ncbi:nuclear transport factor 2 family protein [Planococcus sp. CPCC 101016]|uniref:YybH family protein n=1 Tax=Planococcus sp. CPCC 101016 TaxID=2599617 RepID=UPI0011B4798D|nr:nuclear transport factor 2 family protein [Planococcus sp. CPCC 101016]TWT07955.1 nuclear transport factor 2 family protein [Planococcus sp. CPCC 101016]
MMKNFSDVQDVLETYRTAIQEKDIETLLSLYASEIHIYDCWESWESKGISSWEANVSGWFSGLREGNVLLKVTFDDVVIEQTSTLAFVHCAVTYTGYHEESGVQLQQTTNRFTYGLKKATDSWAIVHEHSSLPIDFETGKGIFD